MRLAWCAAALLLLPLAPAAEGTLCSHACGPWVITNRTIGPGATVGGIVEFNGTMRVLHAAAAGSAHASGPVELLAPIRLAGGAGETVPFSGRLRVTGAGFWTICIGSCAYGWSSLERGVTGNSAEAFTRALGDPGFRQANTAEVQGTNVSLRSVFEGAGADWTGNASFAARPEVHMLDGQDHRIWPDSSAHTFGNGTVDWSGVHAMRPGDRGWLVFRTEAWLDRHLLHSPFSVEYYHFWREGEVVGVTRLDEAAWLESFRDYCEDVLDRTPFGDYQRDVAQPECWVLFRSGLPADPSASAPVATAGLHVFLLVGAALLQRRRA